MSKSGPYAQGAVVGGWRIDALLDDGPTTLTYRVREAEGTRRGVLRLLKIQDDSFAERLRRNAQALSSDRENLVPVLGVVEHDGRTGVVSAWIDGPDLGRWSQGDAPLGHRLALFEDVIAGLDQAHRANLVHRNLKPGKIRVSLAGGPLRAYLEDFLLSRVDAQSDHALTGIGVTFGTPQYMSPEQFHGAAEVSARGDLFSAGCVLYELVTRKRAFDGTSIREVYMAIIEATYTDPRELVPKLPDELHQLIRDLLEPATEDRPASAAAVLERLRSPPLADLIERPELPRKEPQPSTVPAAPPGPEDATGAPASRRTTAPAPFPTLIADDLSEGDATEPPGDDAPWSDEELHAVRGSRRALWMMAGATLLAALAAAGLVSLLIAGALVSG